MKQRNIEKSNSSKTCIEFVEKTRKEIHLGYRIFVHRMTEPRNQISNARFGYMDMRECPPVGYVTIFTKFYVAKFGLLWQLIIHRTMGYTSKSLISMLLIGRYVFFSNIKNEYVLWAN
jgi:hypothetical protein